MSAARRHATIRAMRTWPILLVPLLLFGCRLHPDAALDRYEYAAHDSTEHFEIHLERGDYEKEFRQALRGWLEETYSKVGAVLGLFPTEKVTVKIYSTPLQTRDRLEYFGYAGKKAIYSKKFHDTRRNLAHEYTHYVAVRLAGVRLPNWFNEGLATFVSNHLDDTGRPTLEEEIFLFEHGDFLRDHSVSGAESINELPTSSANIRRRYAYGSSFLSYLVEEHGFPVILEALAAAKEEGGLERALSDLLEQSFEEIDAGWVRYLRSYSDPQRYDKYGPIRDWHVIGPFENSDGRGFSRSYPPEGPVNLGAAYPALGSVARWRKFRSNHPTGMVDILQCQFAPSRYAVAYATATVHAPAPMEVQIRAGGDDTLTLWLNGEILIQRHHPRAFRLDQETVTTALQEGENTILVKICQSTLDWRFAAGITDSEGRAIPGLVISPGED